MDPRRLRLGLKLLAVALVLLSPATFTGAATANSAFEQYVETPPSSGSELQTPNSGTKPGTNRSTPQKRNDSSSNRGSGQGYQNDGVAPTSPTTSESDLVTSGEGDPASSAASQSERNKSKATGRVGTQADRLKPEKDGRPSLKALGKVNAASVAGSSGGIGIGMPIILALTTLLAAVAVIVKRRQSS